MLYREWNIKTPNREKSDILAKEIGAGRLLSDVLVSRGYETREMAAALLDVDAELSDPFLLTDMDKAVERIHAAIHQEEPMVIFGDYDVDGITATALLYSCLESMGAQVFYKISSRSDDGYGLSVRLVDQIADKGIPLIITVDNGTSALEAAQRAEERGVDLIITDHHLVPQEMPKAVAHINPCRPDDQSPFKNFSGVGVAFMLAAALEGCPAQELLPEFGDLAAVGTVADVMKLTGENRILVREGLKALQNTSRPGLAALIEQCGWQDRTITADNISYGLAPRINAAGRMDDATKALHLLLADSLEEAREHAQSLEQSNQERQKAEQEIFAEIVQQIEDSPELQRARVLVVWGENWNQGIVGIVSSRLVEKYAKPSIVISFEGDEGRGSGRSMAGFSLYNAIADCAPLLIRFGGHDLAAGLSISRENAPLFREKMNVWAAENCPVMALPELSADACLSLEDATVENVRQLDALSPCGSGNPAPRFYIQDALVDAVYPVSEGKHCRLRLRCGSQMLYAVLFGTGPSLLAYKQGDKVDALVSLSIYEGKAGSQVSARIFELRPAGLGNEHVAQSMVFHHIAAGGIPTNSQKQMLYPTREQTAAVYRAVRDNPAYISQDLRPFFFSFGEQQSGKVLTALAALQELELIGCDKESGRYTILPVTQKRDLSASPLLKRLEVKPDGL